MQLKNLMIHLGRFRGGVMGGLYQLIKFQTDRKKLSLGGLGLSFTLDPSSNPDCPNSPLSKR